MSLREAGFSRGNGAARSRRGRRAYLNLWDPAREILGSRGVARTQGAFSHALAATGILIRMEDVSEKRARRRTTSSLCPVADALFL